MKVGEELAELARLCACGKPLPAYRGTTFICSCGRQYDRPRVSLERLVARIDEQERRIIALEEKLGLAKHTEAT